MSQVRFTLSPTQARVLQAILLDDRARGGRTAITGVGQRVLERVKKRMVIHQVWEGE